MVATHCTPIGLVIYRMAIGKLNQLKQIDKYESVINLISAFWCLSLFCVIHFSKVPACSNRSALVIIIIVSAVCERLKSLDRSKSIVNNYNGLER